MSLFKASRQLSDDVGGLSVNLLRNEGVLVKVAVS